MNLHFVINIGTSSCICQKRISYITGKTNGSKLLFKSCNLKKNVFIIHAFIVNKYCVL